MCPRQIDTGHNTYHACPVCGLFLWLTDNDWPFCSPACRRIDEETAVLLLPGPPEEVHFGDSGH